MNRIPHEKRVQVLRTLLDGTSMRATSRITGVAFNTIKTLLIQAGKVAAAYHDVHVRDVQAKYVECDEVWSYIFAKAKRVAKMPSAPPDAGSIWTWTALDADSKLIIAYLVGGRSMTYATTFLRDLNARLARPCQLTTDGYAAYEEAISDAFGRGVDYAQDLGFGDTLVVSGNPDPDHISTAYVERQNLTMRMCMRRFTRKTNAFSKKAANHVAMICLYFLYYNFCRIHQSVRMTPAMAAGIDPVLHDVDWIAELVEQAFPEPSPRGSYRKKFSN